MRFWRNVLVGACLLSFVVVLGLFNASKPRILVLHSGVQDSPWVRAVDDGMRQALRGNRRPVTVEWAYLGAVSPAARTEVAVADARRVIGGANPDVLIAVDDEANSLVARDYVGRTRPRILYVSLDRPPASYGYPGASNVSGIAEDLPWRAVRDAVSEIFPGRNATVAVIGVDNETGRAEMAQARAFDWGHLALGPTTLVATAPAWREFVDRSARTDVLLVLSVQDMPDDDGTLIAAAEIDRWTQQHAKSLPIGLHVGFVEAGGALSFSPSPDYYGQQAIRMALDWLDDRTTPGPPPPVESAHFEVAIRRGLLAERGVRLPPIYLEAARENGTLFD